MPRWPLAVAVLVTGGLALAGATLSAGILTRGGSRTAESPPADVTLHGFTTRRARRPSAVEYQAAVTLTNRGDRAVAYAARDFGLLTSASGTPLAVERATLGAGALPPRAAVDGLLVFVAPAEGVPLALLVHPPGNAGSQSIAFDP